MQILLVSIALETRKSVKMKKVFPRFGGDKDRVGAVRGVLVLGIKCPHPVVIVFAVPTCAIRRGLLSFIPYDVGIPVLEL